MDEKEKFVMGIDGGGTKTVAAVANNKGKILKKAKAGPSNLRNVGIAGAVENISRLVKSTGYEDKVFLYYIALSSVDEEFSGRKEEIGQELQKSGLKGEIIIEGDRRAAFRCGTDEKDGVLVVCGTGAAAHGWKNGKEKKASGWGYFGDEGSAFYAGIEGYRAALKNFDGRGEKTKIIDLMREIWGVRTGEELNRKIYADFKTNLPLLSVMVKDAAESGDKTAKDILQRAGEELFLSTRTVIEELGFKSDFPLMLVGGMFRSFFLLSFFKKQVIDNYPRAKIILPDKEPAEGAVKIAIESLNKL